MWNHQRLFFLNLPAPEKDPRRSNINKHYCIQIKLCNELDRNVIHQENINSQTIE